MSGAAARTGKINKNKRKKMQIIKKWRGLIKNKKTPRDDAKRENI